MSRSVISSSVKLLRRAAPLKPSKDPIFLSPAAEGRIRTLLSQNPTSLGLKIGVREKGCSGLSYDLSYCFEKDNNDLAFSKDDITVFITNRAQMSILGSEMDFIEDELGSEFVFKNPNIKSICGCGQSFSVDKKL